MDRFRRIRPARTEMLDQPPPPVDVAAGVNGQMLDSVKPTCWMGSGHSPLAKANCDGGQNALLRPQFLLFRLS